MKKAKIIWHTWEQLPYWGWCVWLSPSSKDDLSRCTKIILMRLPFMVTCVNYGATMWLQQPILPQFGVHLILICYKIKHLNNLSQNRVSTQWQNAFSIPWETHIKLIGINNQGQYQIKSLWKDQIRKKNSNYEKKSCTMQIQNTISWGLP